MAIISCHGYRKLFVGYGHHLADSKGYAYEHRIVAEKILGKPLQKGEIVHHKNGNKLNNQPENLEIVIGNAGHYLHHRKRTDLRKPNEENPLILCRCGCSLKFKKFDSSGRPRKYLSSHNMNLRRKTIPLCACGCGIQTENFKKKFLSTHRAKTTKKYNNPEIFCACGCNVRLKRFDIHGRERKYISGHNGRKQNALLG